VYDLVARYYHVLTSLSQDAVRLVRHVLHETGPNSYANLRTSLLASYSLSNYQKMERMMKLLPLGDRKLSVMLAEMLEYCPVGESTTAIFTYLFLQRLPREIRVLLSEDDPADVQAIADKARHLIAMHMPQHHKTCAAVAGSENSDPGNVVAATQNARRKKLKLPVAQRPQQQQQKSQVQRQEASRRPQGVQGGLRKSMCFYHAKYGEQACFCEEGCLWLEN
jgi:hypothetical protein